MAKVGPFRSANPADLNVYHCSESVYGQAIPARHVMAKVAPFRQHWVSAKILHF